MLFVLCNNVFLLCPAIASLGTRSSENSKTKPLQLVMFVMQLCALQQCSLFNYDAKVRSTSSICLQQTWQLCTSKKITITQKSGSWKFQGRIDQIMYSLIVNNISWRCMYSLPSSNRKRLYINKYITQASLHSILASRSPLCNFSCRVLAAAL